MSYILGTTETIVRWYQFVPGGAPTTTLLEVLDLSRVTSFVDKGAARNAAQAAGLATWRYVRI
jgi:hypothetical protein